MSKYQQPDALEFCKTMAKREYEQGWKLLDVDSKMENAYVRVIYDDGKTFGPIRFVVSSADTLDQVIFNESLERISVSDQSN